MRAGFVVGRILLGAGVVLCVFKSTRQVGWIVLAVFLFYVLCLGAIRWWKHPQGE